MDAFSGYHQIFMDPADKEKTAFICLTGVFNYIMMPFGLKNARATYQRLMDKIFKDQRGRNLEVYVDDSTVKSKTEEEMIVDLQETFSNMREYTMKLNPRKCVFGIKSGKFLGYLVSQRGIDANPEKVQEQSQAFKEMKKHLHRLPTLARPITGETLYLYILITQHTMSAGLIREEKKFNSQFIL